MAEQAVQAIMQELARINTKLDIALERIEDHETRLRCVEEKGGKRWDAVVGQIINVAVAAGLGLMLGKLF